MDLFPTTYRAPNRNSPLFNSQILPKFGKITRMGVLEKYWILLNPVNLTIFFKDIHEMLPIMSFMYHK